MKKIFLVCAVLLLSACVGGARNAPPLTVFDFGLPAERIAAYATHARLALEVRSPPWFDSLNVDYRLAYEDPLKPREYAGSRWAGPPASLLAQRLRQQLGMVASSANTAADCVLRVELQEFSQVFDSANKSHGVLQGVVSLIDGRRQLVDGRLVHIEKPATTQDAAGGVGALVAASDELGFELANWLSGLDRAGRAPSCLRAR